MRFWVEWSDFFREFRRQFRTTGAILPSSRFLARALVSQLKPPRPAARILEVGPGTGSVTCAIAGVMLPEDRLDAVEINDRFVRLLEKRVEEDRAFQHRRDQIQIIHAPVEQLLGESVYDFIVSGLPLNNFAAAQVRAIFTTYQRLLKPGGTLTYYEYVLVRELKTPFVDRRERRRLVRVGRLVSSYVRNYQIRRERVFVNVPPATVRHLRFRPAEPVRTSDTPASSYSLR
jgi:phospholipid N-methyltransferase